MVFKEKPSRRSQARQMDMSYAPSLKINLSVHSASILDFGFELGLDKPAVYPQIAIHGIALSVHSA